MDRAEIEKIVTQIENEMTDELESMVDRMALCCVLRCLAVVVERFLQDKKYAQAIRQLAWDNRDRQEFCNRCRKELQTRR